MLRKKNWVILFLILGITNVVSNLSFVQSAEARTSEKIDQKVFVQLGKGTEDLHAAIMALKLSHDLQAKGAKVTLFLNLEAVRIADKRQNIDLQWGPAGGSTLRSLYDGFVTKGGTILICRMCANAAGLEDANLRNGSKIQKADDEVAMSILNSDKTLSY